jgi:Cof subfamily protein (haloacid dehalogenase superfamily)
VDKDLNLGHYSNVTPIDSRAEYSSGLPRLIAIDLDGTLLGAGFAVSRRSAIVLNRVAAAGAVIVLVTGRSMRKLARVFEELGTRYAAICANGAIVYDPTDDLPRLCRLLAPAEARAVCRRIQEQVPDVMFAAEVDCGTRLLHSPGWSIRKDDRDVAFPAGLEELTATEIVKLQARAPGRNSDSFNKLVTDAAGDLVEATCPGYDGLVEMTRKGVTKASALAIFAAKLGIHPVDALAFGDMPNDISMLRWAGRSVVVANAHPEARAAADEITLSNLDDGVAAYLERWLDVHY